MLSELEIIDRCLLLFSKPGRWTTKVNARDRNGKPVPVFSEEAKSFDIEGAIRRAAGRDDRGAYARFVTHTVVIDGKRRTSPGPLVAQITPHKNPFDWNDAQGRKQRDVVMMLNDLADMFRFKETG
jgi:hypothetical protein